MWKTARLKKKSLTKLLFGISGYISLLSEAVSVLYNLSEEFILFVTQRLKEKFF